MPRLIQPYSKGIQLAWLQWFRVKQLEAGREHHSIVSNQIVVPVVEG